MPALVLLAGNVGWAQPRPSSGDKARLERFEQQVESVRGRLKIPGLSVAIVKDHELLWAKGFGFADLENRVPATPDTLYSIASLTDNRIFTVTREGDRLFVTLPSKTEVFPESESTFFLKTRPYKFVFTKAEGQAAQLEIVEGGESYRSKRIQ